MDAKLIINGVETLLGHEELKDICYNLVDSQKNQAVFAELAKSPSARVRKRVADMEHLCSETVRLLLQDSCIDVVREVVMRYDTLPELTRQEIERLIEIGDTELTVNLVIGFHGNSEQATAKERTWFYGKLVNHSDPEVRSVVAGCDSVPVSLLKKLTEDDDINVSGKARETLMSLAKPC